MKGLLASMLHICPLIGVEKVGGTYAQLGMAPTFSRALRGLVNIITQHHPVGSHLMVQLGHALNPAGVEILRKHIEPLYKVSYLPTASLSPVLAAHTGPSMVGVAFAPFDDFSRLFSLDLA
jgi:fatty acid-binding protein DegV